MVFCSPVVSDISAQKTKSHLNTHIFYLHQHAYIITPPTQLFLRTKTTLNGGIIVEISANDEEGDSRQVKASLYKLLGSAEISLFSLEFPRTNFLFLKDEPLFFGSNQFKPECFESGGICG